MNVEQRNAIVVELQPKVKRLVRNLRIDAQLVDDCIQAGNLAVIKAIDSWAAAHPGQNWDAAASMKIVEKAIKTDILREKARLESAGDTNFENLPEVSPRSVGWDDFNDETWEPASQVHSGTMPIVNEDNEDTEAHVMRERLIELIKTQKGTPRTIGLGVLAGFSVSEIAARIGISQSAADRVYQTLVKQLKAELVAGSSS